MYCRYSFIHPYLKLFSLEKTMDLDSEEMEREITCRQICHWESYFVVFFSNKDLKIMELH